MFRVALVLAAVGALAVPLAASASPAPFTANATQTADTHSGITQHFAETLRVSGKVVGHDKITCTVTTASTAKCSAVFKMITGTIAVAGKLKTNTANNTLAIVGGSGAYKGASGQLHLTFLSDTKAIERFVFS